ncbi:Bowman-Birk type wound-induced proteinase inhibitor WIP1 [Brachypodium distachyon]|uniref:Bowman-Birk serine protease inhibitors family domain-containing protein n=1 Tax=Brachypodium distachyon TaxID=15368 RepID=I1HBP1_BRADI|nr:Bowman-Birk type wound-induced proteinase inhibitor WIP1 [Brachypodium distachyon]KQK02540.1 hypothetical protein BRADI_2g02150v3 [Brachypodium distachyon]|eukprot:XP_003568052.1 Bowman-Birk type wound-induced proteinase inhibitor WIP1 [Brachypodium distachyon]
MKSSTVMVICLVLQAALAIGTLADNHTPFEESKAIDINPGKLGCCSSCNFSFSGLYTCDDLVKKCDPVCNKCAVVKTYPLKQFRCVDTFLGICDPPCGKKN